MNRFMDWLIEAATLNAKYSDEPPHGYQQTDERELRRAMEYARDLDQDAMMARLTTSKPKAETAPSQDGTNSASDSLPPSPSGISRDT